MKQILWERQAPERRKKIEQAIRDGNRYQAIVADYMPFFYEYEQLGLTKPLLLSDQPRLNYMDGVSRIQERSGPISVPGLGFRYGKSKTGFCLCFGQAGDTRYLKTA
jgi:hypothetical protein